MFDSISHELNSTQKKWPSVDKECCAECVCSTGRCVKNVCRCSMMYLFVRIAGIHRFVSLGGCNVMLDIDGHRPNNDSLCLLSFCSRQPHVPRATLLTSARRRVKTLGTRCVDWLKFGPVKRCKKAKRLNIVSFTVANILTCLDACRRWQKCTCIHRLEWCQLSIIAKHSKAYLHWFAA